MSYSSANEAARQQSGASEETVAFAQPESATPVSAEEESALATADAPEEGAASAETAEGARGPLAGGTGRKRRLPTAMGAAALSTLVCYSFASH